jgi:tryptophan synthase alpha chain
MAEPIRIEATDAPKDATIQREATMAEVRRAPVDGPDRIARAFARARDEDRAALVIYLSAGYPDPDTSLACFHAAAEAGADLLEVGIPFSDPMMDGPVIQQANQHVLDSGQSVTDHLALCTLLTAELDVPALAMTYVTIADARGYDAFAEACAAAGLAGVILPDLPAREGDDWRGAAAVYDLATVFLASSVSTDERLDAIARVSSGFVYAAGLLGVTGVKQVAQDDTRVLVERIRARTDTPVAVGIGVKTADDARAVAAYADGVIVGSAVVHAIGDGDPAGAPERVGALVRELRQGCDRG